MQKSIFKITSMAVILLMTLCSVAYAQPAEPEAKAAILIEYETGEVLYQFNADKKLPIASVTKIMTLCLIFDAIESGKISAEDAITVGPNAAGMGGSQVFLESGGKYKAKDLIKSIIIASANDACVAMAEHLAGSQENFVAQMNEKASALGMRDTHFVNCTGMPAENHLSTASDVAKMSTELLKHEMFFQYSSIWMDKIEHSGGRVTELTNTNKLVRFFEGCDGVKTGYTSEAGHCISATVEKNGMRLISVIIGGETGQKRFDDARDLINYGFANYMRKKLLDDIELPQEIKLDGGMVKCIKIKPSNDPSVVLKKEDEDALTHKIELAQSVSAPIHEGDKVGEIIFELNGNIISRIDIVAAQDGEKATVGEYFNKLIENW